MHGPHLTTTFARRLTHGLRHRLAPHSPTTIHDLRGTTSADASGARELLKMSGYGRYYRPALKSSVDVQLQTAFNEGLWSTVVRLAAQRFKTKKDPYYDVRSALPRFSRRGDP